MILTWWVDVVESVTLSFMTWPVVECPVSMARQKVIHLSSGFGRPIIKVGYIFLTLATTWSRMETVHASIPP